MDSKYCQTVKDALNGIRTLDEQTLTSLAVLGERLERLKRLDKVFSGVTFSSAVKKLIQRKSEVAVH